MIKDLELKIGQMIMAGFRGTKADSESPIVRIIKKYNPGGVWIVDNENPLGESIGNIASRGQLRQLTYDLQNAAEVPLLISIDAEGGRVIRLKEIYGFPATYSARYLGEKDDPELTREQNRVISGILKDTGVNLNLAPVVDLFINPANPALGGKERCFSADPEKVTAHARSVIEAHHEKNILCCLKHFPGHGSSTEDTHIGYVDVSNTWTEKELIPYQKLIDENLADIILTAHIYNRNLDPDYPATLSHNILTKLLRERMGFKGVVISDDILMGAIRNNYKYEEAILLAVNAGVDIILQSNVVGYTEDNVEEIFNVIRDGILNGKIPESRVEESYERIQKLKKRV